MSEKIGVRVAGAISGLVYLPSLESTVQELREEIGNLLGAAPESLKLLLGGRNQQDNQKKLSAAGINANSKVLVIGCSTNASTEMAAAEAKQHQLQKLKRVLDSMAKRDAQIDDNALDLYNQHGQKALLKAEDKQALTIGLMLHDRGRALMYKGQFAEALEALAMAEESFGLASHELLQMIDNYGLLLLDSVWCYYKLQDVRRLAVAQHKLQAARAALANAHGPNLERVRRIHGTGFCPEIATYLRLEVMEGVVAYQTGDLEEAEKALGRAFNKWKSLQGSDEQLALLQEMGHGMKESKRALRFSGGNVQTALDFIHSQRAQAKAKKQQQTEDSEWKKERKRFGRIQEGAYVDKECHQRLVKELGYDSMLAGEALRSRSNDFNAALDALIDPSKRAGLTLALSLRIATEGESQDSATPKRRRHASNQTGAGGQGDPGPSTSAAAGGGQGERHSQASAGGVAGSHDGSGDAGDDKGGEGGQDTADATATDMEAEEMQRVEDELMGCLEEDPMAAYDVDVAEEGSIIDTYKVLLHSAR